jgi:hypothetical protein
VFGLHALGEVAEELLELLEVAEHDLDLAEGPLDLIALVELFAELLLQTEAALARPVDLASTLAATGFLLLNTVLAVAAEDGIVCEVARRTHLALAVVLGTLTTRAFREDSFLAAHDERLAPVIVGRVVLLAAGGIFQSHPDGVVNAIHRVISKHTAEFRLEVIERKLRRLVRRRLSLHKDRTSVI